MDHPLDDGARLSCLIKARQWRRALDYIKLGLDEGAELLAGGVRATVPGCEHGFFTQPMLILAKDDMRICREEIFEPVLSLIVREDYEAIIAQTNDTDYGLASGIYTGNLKHAMENAAHLEAGSVWINRYSNITDGTAFGVYKISGIARGILPGNAECIHLSQDDYCLSASTGSLVLGELIF
ncbi:aldehyde dehydrogenase family protein [Pseudomonas sp. DWP1b1]|uniref:aldehyde dehydrogenase family protein n=1 Tax=unclassified Pseudomonas TaxID=196821 RepID=UPI003CF9D94B